MFAGAVAAIVKAYMTVKAVVTTAWSMAKTVLSPIAKVGVEMLMMLLKVLLWVLIRVIEAVPVEKLQAASLTFLKFLDKLVKKVGEDHPVVQELSSFSVESKSPLPRPMTKVD